MWEQLPKLLDRDFFVGYFLPALLFVLAALWVLFPVPMIHKLLVALSPDLGGKLIAAGIAAVILGMQLLLFNRFFLRTLEGYYWPLKHIAWLTKWQVSRYRIIDAQITQTRDRVISILDRLDEIAGRLRQLEHSTGELSIQIRDVRNEITKVADQQLQAKNRLLEIGAELDKQRDCLINTRSSQQTSAIENHEPSDSSIDRTCFNQRESPSFEYQEIKQEIKQEKTHLEREIRHLQLRLDDLRNQEIKLKTKQENIEVSRVQLEQEKLQLECEQMSLQRIYDKKSRKLLDEFPHDPAYILPTAFGNVMRSFEVYSYQMYGIDSIPAWYRIRAVIPAEFMNPLASSKAMLDSCLNYLFLSIAFVVVVSGRMWFEVHQQSPFHWKRFIHVNWWEPVLIVVSVGIMVVAYESAKHAAAGWGNYFKAAFDLYNRDLAHALGYESPPSRDTWRQIVRSFLYRKPFPRR